MANQSLLHTRKPDMNGRTAHSCTHMRKADRDLAAQLVTVRAFAQRVPLQVANRQGVESTAAVRGNEVDGATDDREERSDWTMRQLFSAEEMQQRLAWARSLRPDAREGVLTPLQKASNAGVMRRIGRPGSSVEFNEMRDDFPHFKEVLDFVWRRALLAGSVAGAAFQLPPMLFDGPPGVGKSAFAERLAAWLNVPITRVDMSSLDAPFKVTGLDAGYSTGKPGVVWDALQGTCISPVLLLDEIDKTRTINSEGGCTFLLGLLEPLTASRFQDACVGLSINAAHIQWLATSNDVAAIDAPLRSRFRVFEIGLPTGDQCVRVVQSVYRALRIQELWARGFPERVSLEVVEALIDRSAREVRQALEDACANAVAAGRRELRLEDVPNPLKSRDRSIGFVDLQSTKGVRHA
jgi:ATP-dependent Lon protease